VRLFAAVWPPAAVRATLLGVPRPEFPGVRWTTPDQWHVTLAFFGDVPEQEHVALTIALLQAAGSLDGPLPATLGGRTELLGPAVLCVAVHGLEALAEAVRREAAGWLRSGREQFSGHVTLCRARSGARGRRGSRRGSLPSSLEGQLVVRTGDRRRTPSEDPGPAWLVDEASLVASTLDPRGSVYRTVARARLGSIPPPG